MNKLILLSLTDDDKIINALNGELILRSNEAYNYDLVKYRFLESMEVYKNFVGSPRMDAVYVLADPASSMYNYKEIELSKIELLDYFYRNIIKLVGERESGFDAGRTINLNKNNNLIADIFTASIPAPVTGISSVGTEKTKPVPEWDYYGSNVKWHLIEDEMKEADPSVVGEEDINKIDCLLREALEIFSEKELTINELNISNSIKSALGLIKLKEEGLII